jgi:hypothetical protein
LEEIVVRDRRVEHDRKTQAAGALDVLLTDRIERALGPIATAVLCQIDMKGNID